AGGAVVPRTVQRSVRTHRGVRPQPAQLARTHLLRAARKEIAMSEPVDRRTFAATFAASVVLGREALGAEAPETAPMPHAKPVEAPFERDSPAPGFNPRWQKPQINRLLVQDFVIFAHMDVSMVSKLLDREPMLVNSVMDWGGGDWESG